MSNIDNTPVTRPTARPATILPAEPTAGTLFEIQCDRCGRSEPILTIRGLSFTLNASNEAFCLDCVTVQDLEDL